MSCTIQTPVFRDLEWLDKLNLPVLLNSVTQVRLQREYAKAHINPLFI